VTEWKVICQAVYDLEADESEVMVLVRKLRSELEQTLGHPVRTTTVQTWRYNNSTAAPLPFSETRGNQVVLPQGKIGRRMGRGPTG
jgi:hypothetical protein